MANSNPTQAAQARRIFVDSYKKLRSFFSEALVKELQTQFDGQVTDKPLQLVLTFTQKVEAPARLWDEADPDTRSLLWSILDRAYAMKQDSLMAEYEAIKPVRSGMAMLDPTNDQPEPEDDEDEDDDDDGNIVMTPVVVIPDVLYHGTLDKHVASIEQTGLDKRRRKCVTLHEGKGFAQQTALRHVTNGDEVVILVIDAKQMLADGYLIEKKDYGFGEVFEVEEVPAKYLKVA